MSDQRRPRDSRDRHADDATEYIPRRDASRGYDSYSSHYAADNSGKTEAYNDYDDFAPRNSNRTEATQFLDPARDSRGYSDDGYYPGQPRQYYEPLPEETYGDPRYEQQREYESGGYNRGDYERDAYTEPRREPSPRSSSLPWIIAGIAVTILIIVLGMVFMNRPSDRADETSTTTTPSVHTITETVPPSEQPEDSNRIKEETDRVRDSFESFTSEVNAPVAAVPDVVGKNGGIVRGELTARGFKNVVYRDSQGNELSLPDSLSRSVVAVEPPVGTEVNKSDQLIITVE